MSASGLGALFHERLGKSKLVDPWMAGAGFNNRLHKIEQHLTLTLVKALSLPEETSEFRVCVVTGNIFADQKSDADTEIVGKPLDQPHRGILGFTLLTAFKLPDMRLRDANSVRDLLQRGAPLYSQVSNSLT